MDNGSVERIGEPEQERLGLFAEEAGEAVQIVGKILRHGLGSHHPDGGPNNAQLLEREVGDIFAAVDLLVACGTLDGVAIVAARSEKLKRLRRWLHHGTNLDAVEDMLRAEQALAHECEATNIAIAEDGRIYCAHCGWNEPQKESR